MNILAFNCFMNDAAAAVMRDGEIVAAAEEERFVRKKHIGDFPFNAIKFCLDYANLSVDELDYVSFNMIPLKNFHRRLWIIASYLPQSLRVWKTHSAKWFSMLKAKSIFQKHFPSKKGAKYNFINIEHHLTHAASAFFPSPFEESAILTWDGSGELASALLARGEGTKIYKIKEIFFPHSAGYLYSSITQYLGFRVHSGEGKVMGLASYGNEEYFKDFDQLVFLDPEGGFRLNLDYFDFYRGGKFFVSAKFIKRFGPPRVPESEILSHHQNIASALQYQLERIGFHLLDYLYQKTLCKNLCIAGGVGLNGLFNGKILNKTPFEQIFIQPASHDAGCSVGACYFISHHMLNQPRNKPRNYVYFGPEFDNSYIEKLILNSGLQPKFFANPAKTAAELLSKGQIIGWFQGRMEFGPRALGNRSILADPRKPDMKDILNKRVKHRESFRPFAPAILLEKNSEYFENSYPSPHMLLIFSVKSDKAKLIPAVIHIDGTGRVQTVSRDENPLFYELISEFSRITGIPVILNTSFNVRGEPIVCTPEEAIACFKRTEMDVLIMGNWGVFKKYER